VRSNVGSSSALAGMMPANNRQESDAAFGRAAQPARWVDQRKPSRARLSNIGGLCRPGALNAEDTGYSGSILVFLLQFRLL